MAFKVFALVLLIKWIWTDSDKSLVFCKEKQSFGESVKKEIEY
jgi:hypothetical protein